jgi:hypothetical protein
MSETLSIGECSRELGVSPRLLTSYFYGRILDSQTCPIVHGRRVIPRTIVPTMIVVLRDRGILKDEPLA